MAPVIFSICPGSTGPPSKRIIPAIPLMYPRPRARWALSPPRRRERRAATPPPSLRPAIKSEATPETADRAARIQPRQPVGLRSRILGAHVGRRRKEEFTREKKTIGGPADGQEIDPGLAHGAPAAK